jgi:hypothetical protein
VACQLADRVRREQHGHQGEQDRQRGQAGGQARGEANRQGHGDRRRHVGDRLEQDLDQADRVALQALLLGGHLILPPTRPHRQDAPSSARVFRPY